MTGGIQLQAQAPAAGGAELGFVLASQIVGQPMAMRAEHLDALIECVAANRFVLPRNRKTGARITEKGTAIIEVHGLLLNRSPSMVGYGYVTYYEGLAEQCRRLETHADVKRVVLDINTPGGVVSGIEGATEALTRLAAKKPVYAIAHDMACSAGYWLACCAKTISVTKDGEVGSIGVRAGHVSYAEALDRQGIHVTTFAAGATKADGALHRLLSDGEAAERGYEIERANDRFVAHVASCRPLSEAAVRETDARCFQGERAVAAKLADRVEGLDDLVARIERGKHKASKAAPRKDVKSSPASSAKTPSAGNKGAHRMEDNALSAEQATVTADAIANALTAIGQRAAAAQPAAAPTPEPQQPSAADERKRVSAILGCDAAKALPALAAKLATEHEVAAEAAIAVLDAAKAAVDAETAKAKSGDGGDDPLARAMSQPGNAAGVKPDAAGGAAAGKGAIPSLAERMAARHAKRSARA